MMVAKYLFDEIKELCLIASKYYNVIEFSHKSKPMSFQLVTHGSMLEFRFEQAVSELPDDTFTASKTVLQLIGDALYFSMTRCFPDETAQTIDACFKYAAICSNGDNTKGIKYHILDKDKDIVIGSCPNCHSIQTLGKHPVPVFFVIYNSQIGTRLSLLPDGVLFLNSTCWFKIII